MFEKEIEELQEEIAIYLKVHGKHECDVCNFINCRIVTYKDAQKKVNSYYDLIQAEKEGIKEETLKKVDEILIKRIEEEIKEVPSSETEAVINEISIIRDKLQQIHNQKIHAEKQNIADKGETDAEKLVSSATRKSLHEEASRPSLNIDCICGKLKKVKK